MGMNLSVTVQNISTKLGCIMRMATIAKATVRFFICLAWVLVMVFQSWKRGKFSAQSGHRGDDYWFSLHLFLHLSAINKKFWFILGHAWPSSNMFLEMHLHGMLQTKYTALDSLFGFACKWSNRVQSASVHLSESNFSAIYRYRSWDASLLCVQGRRRKCATVTDLTQP